MGSRFGPQRLAARLSLGFLLISGTTSAGCVNSDGEPLPPGLMSFPIAIELSLEEDPTDPPGYVFVANSNFALEYNSGSLQSYDLQKLNEAIDQECIGAGITAVCVDNEAVSGIRQACLDGTQSGNCNCDPDVEPDCVSCDCDPVTDSNCIVVPPDRCSIIPEELRQRDPGAALKLVPVEGLLRGEAQIGSFADGLDISPTGRRLYIPVRSDANLTFIDVNEQGQLDCGSGFVPRQSCQGFYRTGSAEQVNPTVPLSLPSDPVDVYAGDLADDFAPPGQQDDPAFRGEYILMAHREGEASMFFDQEREGVKRPRLAATLDELAPEQVTITYEPGAKRAWIPSALAREVTRVGIGIDGDPTQSYLFNGGTLFVTGIDQGTSIRDIAFDPRPGRDLAYMVSRSPESLVVAQRNTPGDQLAVVDQVSVCRGPSRVQLAELPAGGATVLVAFVSCFNARNVQVIDTELFQGISVLTNISGAFEFVVDVPRLRMYIADFSTSVLRIANLEPLVACLDQGATAPEECSPEVIGLVGLPQPISGRLL